MFTRVDELRDQKEIRQLLSVIVDAAELDPAKATTWTFARTVDYGLWALEQGLTLDPSRCYRVAEALAPLVDR